MNRSIIFGITTIEGSISAFQLRDDEPRSGLWGRHSMMILGFVLLPSKRSYFSLDLLCLATIQAAENKSESNAIYPDQNRRTDPEELVEQTYPRTEMPPFQYSESLSERDSPIQDSTASEKADQYSDLQEKEAQHGTELYQINDCCKPLILRSVRCLARDSLLPFQIFASSMLEMTTSVCDLMDTPREKA